MVTRIYNTADDLSTILICIMIYHSLKNIFYNFYFYLYIISNMYITIHITNVRLKLFISFVRHYVTILMYIYIAVIDSYIIFTNINFKCS